MIRGPYHNLPNILPQFTEPRPDDINDEYGLKSLNPENTVITYSSDGKIPEEFKDYHISMLENESEETITPADIKKAEETLAKAKKQTKKIEYEGYSMK